MSKYDYDLTASYKMNSGEVITIAIDEYPLRVIAFTQEGKEIGAFDIDETENDMNGFYQSTYYITHMFLDKIPGYTGKGIGRACLEFFNETYGCTITAAHDDGLTRDDGSHLTGAALAFVAKMRDEGIIL